MDRVLILEDGLMLRGRAIGYPGEASGELIVHNGLTDYQGILTDPAGCGQLVVMTAPLIGNHGINRYDFESLRPWVGGVLVRELCTRPSHFRLVESLGAYLSRHRIPGIEGLDTRLLARHLRDRGPMRAAIQPADCEPEEVLWRLRHGEEEPHPVTIASAQAAYRIPGDGRRVVLVDYGTRTSTVDTLSKRGYAVTVVPWNTESESILAMAPDGVVLGNGPGDPAAIPGACEMVEELLGNVPVMGLCLGFQLLCLACGAESYRLPFGHRGSNKPVREIETGRILITAQNHGYGIDTKSLESTGLRATFENVNDGLLEGVEHKRLPAFGVQFLPEIASGPHDAMVLYDRFDQMMEEAHAETNRHS